ncbi:hypothetical protein [uncultured Rikenella sp.]|uniref:hypothetical protein n=1 Tax=uncultured Rikenella sp. TaxID=368003 RepID=UPI00272C0ED8|nr:hypothetical protein [uncultured Rikenella sp.]
MGFLKAFGRNLDEYHTLLEMPDTYIIYRFFFEWLDKKKHKLGMSQWVKTINSMTAKEQKIFFDIIHDKDFKTGYNSTELPKLVQKALSFYRNLRDAIQQSDGELHELKLEFDALPKGNLDYIKDSFAGTIRFKAYL